MLFSRWNWIDIGSKTEVISTPEPVNGFDLLDYNTHPLWRNQPTRPSDLVYTIGSEPREDIGLDEQFIFKKSNPIVPAVVHQYNRHPDLLDFVKKKFGV